MNDTTTLTRRDRTAAWILTHRTAAIAIGATIAILIAGGTVAASTVMTKQHAVDEWTSTRSALGSTAKRAATWTTQYDRARKQAVDTVAAAKDLAGARDGTLSQKLWDPLESARTTTERTLKVKTPAGQVPAPKLEDTSRDAYERATRVGTQRLAANRDRVKDLQKQTRALQQARATVLAAGGKLAAATRGDEVFQTRKTPDATDEAKDAVHDAVGVAVRAQKQHPNKDVVLTGTHGYLIAVTALRKSNADEAARKAEEAAQAAAAASSAVGSSTTSSNTGRGSAGTGSGSRSWSGGRGSGSSAPAAGGGAAGGGGSASAPAPAPAPGPAPGGSSGDGSTARPPQYALQHSTRVASCNPGEYTLSFGPNVNSMPSRYLTVSTSWNGSAWVYSGTTCGS